jgi:hypothetical protein
MATIGAAIGECGDGVTVPYTTWGLTAVRTDA